MDQALTNLLASYGWWIVALALIASEIIAPGYFLLWIGLAAGLVGLVALVFPSLPFGAQAVLFALFAIATCTLYWKYIRPAAEHRDDQPLLNRRGERMVGRRVIVVRAIVNGRGKVKVGDGEWLAEGLDVPVGTEVEVVGVSGTTLRVEVRDA